jgi:hypothetical protein
MAIFAIISQPDPNAANLPARITAEFPAVNYPLGNGAWLVAGQGTAELVSARLGLTGTESGAAVVLEVASYFGRANPAIWTWIKTNWEGKPIG